jgi:hypothetical protein
VIVHQITAYRPRQSDLRGFFMRLWKELCVTIGGITSAYVTAPPATAGVDAASLTQAAIVSDIGRRLRYGPVLAGQDRRALPPVDDAMVAAQTRLEQARQAQQALDYERKYNVVRIR